MLVRYNKVHHILGMVSVAVVLLGFGCGPAVSGASDWMFETIPADGSIAGPAGSTIGWGYATVNNSPDYWLYLFDISSSVEFPHAVATKAPFDFPVLAPGESLNRPYDGQQGLVELTWNHNAPVGFSTSGMFEITAFWYNGDPFEGGDYVNAAIPITVPFTVSVVPEPSVVPESSSVALALLGGLAGRVGLRRRRR